MGTRQLSCTVIGWLLVLFVAACGDNAPSSPKDDAGPEAGLTCTAPEIACNGVCLDPTSDEANCGACGTTCAAGETCSAGDCQTTVTCTSPETACNNTCVNPTIDEANCGTCGTTCSANQSCIAGSCVTTVACTSPEVNCNNVCKNTQTDEQNCGTCGNTCSNTQTCVAGSCQTTVTCTSPEMDCNNVCRNTQTDEMNCGTCGNTCSSTQTCVSGTCQTTVSCTSPEMDCNNVCVNPTNDEANCGTCGTTCGSNQECLNSVCVPVCTSPEQLCGNACFDTTNDEQHCGNCTTVCAADETCTNSVCVDTCTAPEQFCNNACINTTADDANCGACGALCPANTFCQNSVCLPVCNAPSQLCGSNCINTTTDPNNCGGCGQACSSDKVCSNSQCVCPSGQTLCNGTCFDLTSDEAHCGSCTTVCNATTETCNAGNCELICTLPERDCGGTTCTNTNTNNDNCGACGNDCDALGPFRVCTGGQCLLTCTGGTSACGNTCVNFQTDAANCGTCGNACASGELCSSGVCEPDCVAPTTLCNGICANFADDEANCGTCGNSCGTNGVCTNGACSCPSTFPNTCPSGCTNTNTDPGNCGPSCTPCGLGQQCDNGVCCGGTETNCAGACTTVADDENNCGACGVVCGVGETCTNGSCDCSFGQTLCPPANGQPASCKTTISDPAACGPTCTVCSGATPFCVSNGCAATCPAPLEACGNQCINKKSDNNNCGTCGTVCGPGTGCSDGLCVNAIAVGPDPAKCVGGGPPIVVPTGPGETTCAGSLGAVTFRFGLCSCTNVGPLGHDLLVDAFDSRVGPYKDTVPARLGGGIGVNGTIQSTANIEAFGEMWVFGSQGQTTKGDVLVHGRFFNRGKFDYSDLVSINEATLGRCAIGGSGCISNATCLGAGNSCVFTGAAGGESASIGGPITKGGGNFTATVSGLLTSTTTACNALPSGFTAGACQQTAFAMTPPCDCNPGNPTPADNQLIPVRAIVQHFSNPANNDNALIGLNSNVLTNPNGAQRLDLPCGNYYLDQINTSNATTIVVHGRTAIYIGGSIVVSQQIIFDLDPDATLDIFVAGVMKTSNTVTVGNPAYPRLSRMYFGSSGCLGSGACGSNADCCSGVCSAGQCAGGAGGNIGETVGLSGTANLNGLFYAGHGTVRVTNPLTMHGAIFANYYDSVRSTIHFDKGAVDNGDECPPPVGNCTDCRDCDNQACVNGQCAQCTDDSQCCSPLRCVNGSCEL